MASAAKENCLLEARRIVPSHSTNFHSEIEAHLSFLGDVELAHTIPYLALAVNTVADAIAELADPDEQVQAD
ncbi:hypothetical protein PMIN03_011516 [Paraphaeosphaeria minitans]|uniref:Uncharacterized protein n=1 Tax=Paraphaeosphaeria minitans TaxID=565426 RepID=A0A9P6KNT5_9PLEO|nr:hypothetical protein PMIN01_08758 [Paraphaeosphaeria minitans]